MIDYLRTTLSSAASMEPVTIVEVKDHLRIDRNLDEEDTLLEDYITTAREFAEGYTGRKFITQTWKYYLDEFPSENYIEMPYAPLISSASTALTFTYKSCSGATNSMSTSDYLIDTDTTPGRINLAYGASWPGSTLSTTNPITITFLCGYGSNAASTPMSIRTWIMSCVGYMYENREADVGNFPVGTLRRYRVGWI